jgi:hypothetical protein
VCFGTEWDAAELFKTAETVPGVSPTSSATDFNVTAGLPLRPPSLMRDFIRGILSLPVNPRVRTGGMPTETHSTRVAQRNARSSFRGMQEYQYSMGKL